MDHNLGDSICKAVSRGNGEQQKRADGLVEALHVENEGVNNGQQDWIDRQARSKCRRGEMGNRVGRLYSALCLLLSILRKTRYRSRFLDSTLFKHIPSPCSPHPPSLFLFFLTSTILRPPTRSDFTCPFLRCPQSTATRC